MFLDFYNFQFSFSQNLPQLTQAVVKMIVFKINVYGPDGIVTFNARVVGFSDRISSLLVPQEFMDWGNSRYAGGSAAKPSRAIIRTKDPGNPALVNYLKDKGLATDADKTRFSRYRHIVDLVVKIAWVTGLLMFLFAMVIFTLFIQLTIASCRDEIVLLVTLGASPRQLRRFLVRQFFPVNVAIIGCSLAMITAMQYAAHVWLQRQNVQLSSWPAISTVVAAFVVLVLIWITNLATIRKYVRRATV
jgi:cell division protein FtsX